MISKVVRDLVAHVDSQRLSYDDLCALSDLVQCLVLERGASPRSGCAVESACAHVWDGPWKEDGLTGEATCSKCGLGAMAHALVEGP